MQEELHPSVLLIKNELHRGRHRYEDVSESTGIPVQRLNNIIAGRLDITLRERDKLCDFLGLSPVILVMQRDDLFAKTNHLDLSGLPEGIRNSLILLHNEICQYLKK